MRAAAEEAGALVAAGGDPAVVADELARAIHDAGDKAPGFGHPVHRPLDPRAERILELADERGVSGQHVLMARELRDAVARVWGRPLTMNVSLPIAAVLLDLGFPASSAKAIPLLARTAGLLAHLAEEREHPVGFLMAGKAEDAVTYERRRGGRSQPVTCPRPRRFPGTSNARSTRRATAPRSRTSSTARRSTARSWPRPDSTVPLPPVGWTTSQRFPSRTSTSSAPRSPGQSVRRAPLRRSGRHRPDPLDERHHGHAELHPAHRGRSGQLGDGIVAELRGVRRPPGDRIVSTYNAGPFVAGAALAALERIGLCHIPVGTGNTERLMLAIEQLEPDCGGADAVLRRLPDRVGGAIGASTCAASSVVRLLVAGEPGGGEPAFRRRLEDGWGARVTEAMGIGDIGPSLWGECEEQDGMHLGARGFVHAELVDPDTGVARPLDRRRHRRARPHAPQAPGRAAPSLPHA